MLYIINVAFTIDKIVQVIVLLKQVKAIVTIADVKNCLNIKIVKRRKIKMGKIITITNQKGGVGKSSSTSTIASMLDAAGYKTLCVDTDNQCNTTDTYAAVRDNVATCYDLFNGTEGVTTKSAIQKTEYGEIIPSDPLLEEINIKIQANPMVKMFKMKEFLSEVKDEYDYIIIDTNPSTLLVTTSCLTASDEVLIPLTPDRYSLQGLAGVINTIKGVQMSTNPDLKLRGTFLVKYHPNYSFERAVQHDLEDICNKLNIQYLKSYIRESVKLREAQAMQMPLIKYDPTNNAVTDYRKLIKEAFGVKIKK